MNELFNIFFHLSGNETKSGMLAFKAHCLENSVENGEWKCLGNGLRRESIYIGLVKSLHITKSILKLLYALKIVKTKFYCLIAELKLKLFS